MPGDPLCWQGIGVGTRGGDYAATIATLSLAPGVIAPDRCRMRRHGTTAPLVPVGASDARGIAFHGRFSAPLVQLVQLDRNNCQARAFLRWARVPFWVDEGKNVVMGDLRYDRSKKPGFAALRMSRRPTSCPKHVPTWVPPRAALLR